MECLQREGPGRTFLLRFHHGILVAIVLRANEDSVSTRARVKPLFDMATTAYTLDRMKRAAGKHRLVAVVHGRVQGVFFRHFTQIEATRLNLAGTVENRPDGTVRIHADGPIESLHALLRWLQDGPDLASVSHVEASWGEASDASDASFRILR